MNQFMLDTNAFNAILDTQNIEPSKLSCCGELFVTHVQLNEIQDTQKLERLTPLLEVFKAIDQETISTAAAVYGVSEWGGAEWGNADGSYDKILLLLEQKGRKSRGNTKDALIGVTALKRQFTLVTNDPRLLASVVELGGSAITLEEFLVNTG